MTKDSILTQLANFAQNIETFIPKDKIEKARSYIKIPPKEERKRITNEKIVGSLSGIGMATKEDIASLEKRISEIEKKLGILTPSADTPPETQPTEGE